MESRRRCRGRGTEAAMPAPYMSPRRSSGEEGDGRGDRHPAWMAAGVCRRPMSRDEDARRPAAREGAGCPMAHGKGAERPTSHGEGARRPTARGECARRPMARGEGARCPTAR